MDFDKKSAVYGLILNHVLKRIHLTVEEQDHFCSLLTIRSLLPRQYVVQQGDVCQYESYVCKGFLRSFYMDEKGNNHTLHFACVFACLVVALASRVANSHFY